MKYDSKGKFGRAMMDFDLPNDPLSRTLCQVLIDEHHAVRYHGQNKKEIRADHEANWAVLEGEWA